MDLALCTILIETDQIANKRKIWTETPASKTKKPKSHNITNVIAKRYKRLLILIGITKNF